MAPHTTDWLLTLLATWIGGEWRFASAVARRLQALGALTQGDRRASGTGGASIQNFNIEQDYGLKALKELYQELEYGTPLTWNKAVPDFIIEAFPGRDQRDSIQKFLAEANDALEKAGFGMMQYNKAKTAKLKTFLNRIMGLKLDIQDLVFQYFMKLMNDRIGKDKASGEYQQSIVDISGSVIELSKLEDLFECPRTGAKAQRALLRTDRGVSWDKANEILSEHTEYVQELGIEDSVSGFYKSANTEDRVAGTTPVVLVLLQRTQQNSIKLRTRFYHVVRPNTGHSPQVYDLNHIRDNFMRATVESQSTKASWDRLHTFYERNCKTFARSLDSSPPHSHTSVPMSPARSPRCFSSALKDASNLRTLQVGTGAAPSFHALTRRGQRSTTSYAVLCCPFGRT